MFKKILVSLGVLILCLVGYIVVQYHNLPSMEPYKPFQVASVSSQDQQGKLTATFIGTATLLISDGETSIMTDGFFSRQDLFTVLFEDIAPNVPVITGAIKKANIINLAAVIPIHSHYDHAMDAPEVAKQTGAMLVGSLSTANIGRGWNLPEKQIKVAKSGESMQFGKFTVTLVRSKHTPMPKLLEELGGFGKENLEPLTPPVHYSKYLEGGSYSVHITHPQGSLLIHGSTNFNDNALADYPVDTLFLGIASLGKQPAEFRETYYQQTVGLTKAKRVIPIHWDDFWQPLGPPLQPIPKLADDFDASMAYLMDKSKEDGFKLQWMDVWDKVILTQ